MYLAYDRAVQAIRHKDSFLDFFKYLRNRAKVSRVNEMAASLSFTTILSIVPMVTVSFSLLAALPSFLKLRAAFQAWLSDNLIPGAIGDPILVYLNQFALKAKGLTIILVEQNFRFAAPLADRHYVMEHGQIVATVHKNELDDKAQMLNEYLGV